MRLLPILLTTLTLFGGLSAQTPVVQEFHLFDGSAEFAWRPLGATVEGEILQKVSGRHFGNLRRAVGVRVRLQDEDQSTGENAWLVLRKATATGKPDLTTAGLILQVGPIPFSGAGVGRNSWNFHFSFPKSQSLPTGDFFYGVRLAAGLTVLDFSSPQMSADYPKNPCGEHPRQGINPGLGWMVTYTNGLPVTGKELGYGLSWDMGLTIEDPLLQPFAVDPAPLCTPKRGLPDFGYAATWPDLVDLEKRGYLGEFGWRVRMTAGPTWPGAIFLAAKRLTPPLALAGVGTWFIDPTDPWFVLVIPLTLDTTGQAITTPLNPPTVMRHLMLGTTLHSQAILIDTAKTVPLVTNWTAISF